MNRLERMQAILTMLQSRRVVRAEDIADRFGISIRTVYRDIRALGEGGIPICAEAGIGYSLVKGYNLPPVMFTHQEARALLLAGKLVERVSDEPTTQIYTNALTKVKAVLSSEKKDDLEGLEEKIIINPFPTHRPETPDLHLENVKNALAQSKVVEVNYFSSGAGEETCRKLEPLGLVFYYNRWHLIAWCRLRSGYRDFRLDRIAKFRTTEESFQRFKHPSLQSYLDKLVCENDLTPVTIEVDNSIVKYIGDTRYHMGLVKESVKDQITEMNFATYSLEYFARWVITLGNRVEIKSPETLKVSVKKILREMCEKYEVEWSKEGILPL